MKKSMRIMAALLALLLCRLPAFAEFEQGEDAQGVQGYGYANLSADVTIGYVASSGARLNPFVCEERDMVSVNSLVYESLFELDGNLQPRPVLAETWGCEDRIWTIKLRSGVMFHNGIEMVAQDVVNSYELMRNAGTSNPYMGRLRLIDSMEATDTFTLRVKSRYPGLITLYALTFPVVQRDTAASPMPMGTGPYWYISYVEDSYIRIEANPLWWKRQSQVGSIVFRHYWDVSQELDALRTGEIDMFQTRSASAALSKRLSYTTSLDYATTTYEMLVPNLSGIMANLNIRKAVMYAIDYNNLTSNVYLDMAQQSEVPIPPGSWLYETRSAVYYYSPERALQYLYDSGWSDLTGDAMLNKVEDGMLKYADVRIIVYDDASSNVRGNAADQIAENLRGVGINATVEKLSLSSLRSRIREGNYDLALVALNLSEVPDLVPLLTENGNANLTSVHTQELDDLLVAAMSATGEADMKNAYGAVQTYLVENLPIMGICFRTGMVLSGRDLAGLSGIRETDAYNGMEFMSK